MTVFWYERLENTEKNDFMRSGICGSSVKDIERLPLEVRNQAKSNWFKQLLKTFRLAFN